MRNENITLIFHHDPGHGWLAVPVALLHQLGITDKITPFSYLHEAIAYLEEDLDASTFITAAEAAGLKLHVQNKYENPTPIRAYPVYRPNSKERPL